MLATINNNYIITPYFVVSRKSYLVINGHSDHDNYENLD